MLDLTLPTNRQEELPALPSVRRWLQGDQPGRPLRIAMYSPGMVGLGHLRRHLLVAQALRASLLRPTILLIAEAREAGAFPMPPGVDCVTLPAIRKNSDGRCTSRHLTLPLPDTVALRADTIRATLRSFAPDVLVVDHLARGAVGELQPALATLRSQGRTRCILGLRDVLEAPRRVRAEWRRWRTVAAIRSYYDAVWIYGDPAVYDLVHECDFPGSVAAKVRYTGYLDTHARLGDEAASAHLTEALGLGRRRLALCLVGGGQDGGPLAEAFLTAPRPTDMVAVVVTGPYMPPEARRRVHALAQGDPTARVADFLVETAPLLQCANRVVAMGGYNSVCDVLSFRKRALIVPRGLPRHEQLIRARRLAGLGAFEMLDPDQVTPGALGAWLAAPEQPAVLPRVDLGGLTRLAALLTPLVAGHPAGACPQARTA